eukprot:12026736-Alexandrium_andersonii.AAC.1
MCIRDRVWLVAPELRACGFDQGRACLVCARRPGGQLAGLARGDDFVQQQPRALDVRRERSRRGH